jgi:hypothetical protein
MAAKTAPTTRREKLSQRPRFGIGAAIVLVLLCVVFLFMQMRGRAAPSPGNAKAFFSVDDGKTWFTDDLTNVPPYDKNGQQAVRAFVYRCTDGTKFVGYLQRFTPDAKRAIEQIQTPDPNHKGPPDTDAVRMAYTIGRQVKRPGDPNWIGGDQGLLSAKIIAVKCPNGGGEAVQIEP